MAESTWLRREVPILEAIAAAEAEGVDPEPEWITKRTGLAGREVALGVQALLGGSPPFVEAGEITMANSVPYYFGIRLLERGRRSVGAWPDEGPALDGFLELLADRIDETENEEERKWLARMLDSAKNVGTPVLSGFLLAYLKSWAGP